MSAFDKPFDGAITRFFEQDAPKEIREEIEKADKNDILARDYPYDNRMKRKDYDSALAPLQIEMMKAQRWAVESGARVLALFEGRDAAGKGGTIRTFTLNTNPRVARVVALSKPTDKERGQWYFQRYVAHLPSAGEMTFFDRSWYNRAGVEPVMGFCTEAERAAFFRQAPEFESMLIEEGVILFKFWLNVSRAEQLRRFLAREADPLKHWKLSPIDVASLAKWDDYTAARDMMFDFTHTPVAPWTVVRSDDKRRARIAAMRHFLSRLPYPGKDRKLVETPFPGVIGDPDSVLSD